jgi:chromosomal replication initiation ATPase DnaA
LGPERFIDWVKGKYYAVKSDQEVPQAQDLAPEADSIINAVCKFYNVSRDELYRSRRGRFNEPRNYSSISSVIERMKKQMLTDRNLKKRANRVANMVNKSQERPRWLIILFEF